MKPRRGGGLEPAGVLTGAGAGSLLVEVPPPDGENAIASGVALPPGAVAALESVLAAVLRMAGASAGVVRAAAPISPVLAVLVAVDVSAPGEGGAAIGARGGVRASPAGPIALWCNRCPESRAADSECVRQGICGCDERFPADREGRVCKHVASQPLGLRGSGAAVLNLRFDGPDGCAAASLSALEAGARVMAAALEQVRLSREALRTALAGERQMMANEVHDSLAQGLTYMRMRMSLLRHAIGEGDSERALKYWGDVDGSLTDAHRRLRELITYFRCRMDAQGLLHALQETSEKFLGRTGVVLEFVNGVPGLDLPVAREVQVFHIVQEALANVGRHADARRARLTLAPRDDGYEITVEDDGVGMAADLAAGERGEAGHYGIAIMRERARRLGGELTVDSAPGAGTRVRLYFPAVDPSTESAP